MEESLRILILEDNPCDAELVDFELREEGFDFTSKVVKTEEDFVRELQEFSPDLILSDYDIPRYDGAQALAEAKKRCPDVPFILVTGAIVEDRAIEILTQGAKDYVLKARLQQRLVPAVRRALAEAEERRARREAEEELREAHKTLEERVRLRTEELEAEMAARKQMEEALWGAKEELEGMVRKRTRELRAASLYARSLIEASLDPLVTISNDGRIMDVNLASEEATGVPRQQLIGSDFSDYFTEPEKARAGYREVFLQGFVRDYPLELKHRDGHVTPVLYNASVYRDETGQIAGVFAAARDITERKQTEEAQWKAYEELEQRIEERTREFRESEEKYRKLVQYAPAAIYEMDLQGTKFFSVNDVMCSILGYSREELLAMRPGDLLDRESASLFRERIQRKLAGERIEEAIEYRIRRKDGEWLHISVNVGAYAYSTESSSRVAVVAYDITERKKAEIALKERTQQLEDANRELESFSYSVSHDLRAPLRAIDGYAKMILRHQKERFDQETQRQFDVIRESARMMGQLIDDLLALSRLGREALTLSRLNMEELIRNVWEELKAANPDRPVELKLLDLPSGMGDLSLIRQVLVNLLANAMKFTRTRETPQIEIGGCLKETEVLYFVRDNGVGFDMQYHDDLFGVFKRLHSKAEYEGTGVGLAIVQRIIRRHGGRVWAEGRVGEGACFYFTLPKG